MNLIGIVNPPVDPGDMKLIELMLKDSNVLVGAGIEQEALYNPADYFLFKKNIQVR